MRLLFVMGAILLMHAQGAVAKPNWSQMDSEYYNTQYYQCISKAAMLFKKLYLGTATMDEVVYSFHQLDHKDKCLVYEAVYLESGVVSNDLNWGEHHVFDDLDLFCIAYSRAFHMKFDRLSYEEKNRVYKVIYELSGVSTDDTRWGERHAFDHIPRFIDAMDIALRW